MNTQCHFEKKYCFLFSTSLVNTYSFVFIFQGKYFQLLSAMNQAATPGPVIPRGGGESSSFDTCPTGSIFNLPQGKFDFSFFP